MRVVVSVGGSVLAPELDPERVTAYATAIEQLVADGCDVGVVVGGGGVAREYIETARALGANEVELDNLGIGTTRLNARLLIAALDDRANLSPATGYDEAAAALRRSEVSVMGGVTPGQTTDAVAAAFAESVAADLLVYATSVPGVFSADPNVDADAERFDELTAGELVDVISSIETAAGSNAPVDLLAAKIIERSGLRAVVLDGSEPGRIADAVGGDTPGTEVHPNE